MILFCNENNSLTLYGPIWKRNIYLYWRRGGTRSEWIAGNPVAPGVCRYRPPALQWTPSLLLSPEGKLAALLQPRLLSHRLVLSFFFLFFSLPSTEASCSLIIINKWDFSFLLKTETVTMFCVELKSLHIMIPHQMIYIWRKSADE